MTKTIKNNYCSNVSGYNNYLYYIWNKEFNGVDLKEIKIADQTTNTLTTPVTNIPVNLTIGSDNFPYVITTSFDLNQQTILKIDRTSGSPVIVPYTLGPGNDATLSGIVQKEPYNIYNPALDDKYNRTIANKQYELKDHLGNVTTVIDDYKTPVSPSDLSQGYTASISSSTNYYPGGMIMPGRNYNSNNYRYGYNKGSEKDDEITGIDGADITTLYREGDTRILRWWSNDPDFNSSQSPYTFMDNNPNLYNDPLGDTVKIKGFKEEKFLNKLAKGLNTTTEKNPFYIDNGKLQIDNTKLSGLSPDQQDIVKNLNETINSDIVFTIKKVSGWKYIPGSVRNYEGRMFLWGWGGSAIYANVDKTTNKPDVSGKSGITILWTGRGSGNVEGMYGGYTPIPSFLIPFHELGGHGYYRYMLKNPDQGTLTIDYENKVRSLHGLKKRKVDDGHSGTTTY